MRYIEIGKILKEQNEKIFEALSKQEPMKPLDSGKDSYGYIVHSNYIFICGCCGKWLIKSNWNFCPYCGQRIDWSEEF